MYFSKAFDTLHVIILGKLNYYGIKKNMLQYVKCRKYEYIPITSSPGFDLCPYIIHY